MRDGEEELESIVVATRVLKLAEGSKLEVQVEVGTVENTVEEWGRGQGVPAVISFFIRSVNSRRGEGSQGGERNRCG